MIAADVGLREDLAICHHYRISHSVFLAWADDDQDKARAYWRFEASTCGGCGTRREQWEPEAGGDRDAFRAAVDLCPGCQVRGDLERELQEGDQRRSGERVVLLPRAVVEAREADRAALRRAREAAVR